MAELLTFAATQLSPSCSQDYGGYLSTYILPAKGENQGPIFTCGSALSPITDFKLYGNALGFTHIRAPWGPQSLPFSSAALLAPTLGTHSRW